MKQNTVWAVIVLAAGCAAGPLMAQSAPQDDDSARAVIAQQQDEQQLQQEMRSDKEVQNEMQKAQQQLRDAERQMREAERKIRAAAREMAAAHGRESRADVERRVERVVVMNKRPALGVILQTESDPNDDKLGARIVGLSPGGPAEEAGVKAGDLIIRVNGQRLTEGDVDVDEDESAPAERLRSFMHDKVKEGDAVALEIKRGGEMRTVTVTARAIAGPQTRTFVFRGEPKHLDIDIPEPPDLGELENLDVQVFTSGWRDLDLAAMNVELGEYFGTGDGVLVVRAGEGGGLQLKGGDVILKIGDRAPGSPSQALRILRSYEAGDTISIEVMRKKTRVTVQGKMPARKTGTWITREAPPAPPAAPAAPHPALAPRAAAPVSQPAPVVQPAAAATPHGGSASL